MMKNPDQIEQNVPNYPEDITQGKLICFVDAAYGNDPKRQRSTMGYAFTYSGVRLYIALKLNPLWP